MANRHPVALGPRSGRTDFLALFHRACLLALVAVLSGCAAAPLSSEEASAPAGKGANAPIFERRPMAAASPSVVPPDSLPEPSLRLPADATEPMSVLMALWPALTEPGEETEDAFRPVDRISGRTVAVLLERARKARAQGDYDHAIAELERALRIEPRNYFVWSALGESYLGKGLYAGAETMARKSNSLARGERRISYYNRMIIDAARAGADTQTADKMPASARSSERVRSALVGQ
jgi:hypothetical protein